VRRQHLSSQRVRAQLYPQECRDTDLRADVGHEIAAETIQLKVSTIGAVLPSVYREWNVHDLVRDMRHEKEFPATKV